MTTIYASSAGASARYYTRYLATDDHGEEDGQWLGGQAANLGLSGVVSTDDLEGLLSGHDPKTGTRLGSALVDRFKADGTVVKAVAGYDATFSAPKSVSTWWGLTGDRGVAEAHDVAVQAVLDHLEHHGATTRIRVNGRRAHPDAQGLSMAAFRQSTSREDDPQLHTHVVISTKVRSPDGRWLALDARYLKRKQRALGGLYQSVLRAELSHRYGVAWGPIVDGQAELAGAPEELLDLFSKRTRQVDELLERRIEAFREREGRDPSRWERAAICREAAADSRQSKTETPVADLATRWRAEADAIGWTPERLVAELTRARPPGPSTATVTVDQVVDQLTANGSTWLPIDVLRAVCDLTPPQSAVSGREWVEVLDAAVERVVAAGIDLDPRDTTGPVRESDGRSIWLEPIRPHLSTEGVVAEEERIVVFAMDAHEQPEAASPTVDVDGLDVLQANAARAVAGDGPLVLVVGPAGTGKTTALARAVADLRSSQRPAFGLAPTAKAARVLETGTGMPADTVAKLLYEWGRPNGADARHHHPAGTTLVVDEAGMLGTHSLDRLVSLAKSQQWRLVLVGDPRQLQAVGRGGMFDELCRTGRVHELATTHRFTQRWEQTATLQLRAASTTALDAYLDHNRVVAGDVDTHLASIADAWVAHNADGYRLAVTAETNQQVDALNLAIQSRRRVESELDTDRIVPVAGSETVSAGDLIVTRRNDRTLRTDDGEPVRNREQWSVDTVNRDGTLTVSRIQGHGSVTLPTDYVRSHVRLGYAATAHGHQGDTVDVSYTLVSTSTTHRGLYVGATRGRHENHLCAVTEEPDLDEARDVLEQVLTNDRADIPAIVQRRELAAQGAASSNSTRQLTEAERLRRRLDQLQRQPVQPRGLGL